MSFQLNRNQVQTFKEKLNLLTDFFKIKSTSKVTKRSRKKNFCTQKKVVKSIKKRRESYMLIMEVTF